MSDLLHEHGDDHGLMCVGILVAALVSLPFWGALLWWFA